MTRSFCVSVAVSCLIGLAVGGCGGSGGASARTGSVSSPTTTTVAPAAAVVQRTRARIRRCLLRSGGHVAVSPDRLLVVLAHNYVRVWVYPSPAAARQVLIQARSYGIVAASLMGTDHTVFYQWRLHPSARDTRLLSRCVRAAVQL